MVIKQPFLIRLCLKHHHNWVVSSSDPYPRVCLKNGLNDIWRKPKIGRCRVGFLLPFGKKKSWCNHGILVFFVFDVNLIAFGVLYNFSHPLPGEFHNCLTQRGVRWDIH